MAHQHPQTNPRPQGRRTDRALQALLLTGLVAAALPLVGCGDSPTRKNNRTVQTSTYQAAGYTASAGDYRVREDVIKTKGLPAKPDKFKQMVEEAARSPEAIRSIAEKREISEDYKTAEELLKSALNPELIHPGLKSAAEGQLGLVRIEQMQHQLKRLNDYYTEALTAANDVSRGAYKLAVLQLEIKRLQATAVGEQEAQKVVNEAKARNREASKALADAEAAAGVLEKSLTATSDEQQKMFQQSKEEQLAADAATGEASVEAYKAALARQHEANVMGEKAAALRQKVEVARNQVQAAAIEKEASDKLLKLAIDARVAAGQRTERAMERVTTFQEQQKAIADQINTAHDRMIDRLSKIGPAVSYGRSQGNEARTSFTRALATRTKVHDSANTLGASKPMNDPLPAALKDRNPDAFLALYSAIASYQSAQISRIGLAASNLRDTMTEVLAKANAIVPDVKVPEKSDTADTNATVAADNLQQAIKSLADARRNGVSPVFKWLVPAYEAQAQFALAQLQKDPSAKDLALKAATEALDANPFLPLTHIRDAQR